MKKVSTILGVYDLFMATGAIWLGVGMVTSRSGTIFAESYPESWEANLPIDNWIALGVLGIIVFGLGNIGAAILSFKKKHNSSWYASAIMGAVFLFGLGYHYFVVGEIYLLVTGTFLALGIVQVYLSKFVYLSKVTKK